MKRHLKKGQIPLISKPKTKHLGTPWWNVSKNSHSTWLSKICMDQKKEVNQCRCQNGWNTHPRVLQFAGSYRAHLKTWIIKSLDLVVTHLETCPKEINFVNLSLSIDIYCIIICTNEKYFKRPCSIIC